MLVIHLQMSSMSYLQHDVVFATDHDFQYGNNPISYCFIYDGSWVTSNIKTQVAQA